MTESAVSPGRIFICYRREDAAWPSGWLFDRLVDRFGATRVFKDVDSIDLGADFIEDLNKALRSCVVLLAMIGTHWLSAEGSDGQRRLDDPDDFVRLEIETALERGIRVIPVLVDGATMPTREQLPASLDRLTRRQALELNPTRFGSDTGRLMAVLGRILEGEPVVEEIQPRSSSAAPATSHPVQYPRLPEKTPPAQRAYLPIAPASSAESEAFTFGEVRSAPLTPNVTSPQPIATHSRSQAEGPPKHRMYPWYRWLLVVPITYPGLISIIFGPLIHGFSPGGLTNAMYIVVPVTFVLVLILEVLRGRPR